MTLVHQLTDRAKPVDKTRSLWTTGGLPVEKALSPVYAGESCGQAPFGLTRSSVSYETVKTEGHPRGNGDGPLTTERSTETKGG